MKKIISIIITIAAIAAGSMIGKSVVTSFFGPDESFDKALAKAASDLNATLPMMVDKETRLDSSMGGPGMVFTYNYTLINYTKDQLNIEALKKELRPSILNYAKTDPSMQGFRDADVKLVYRYKDKNSAFLFDISIQPEEYQ